MKINWRLTRNVTVPESVKQELAAAQIAEAGKAMEARPTVDRVEARLEPLPTLGLGEWWKAVEWSKNEPMQLDPPL